MRVLMLGWEFPPYFAGGVGMVCYELAKQLSSLGMDVEYVMPYAPDEVNPDFLQLVNASKFVSDEELAQEHIHVTRIPSLLAAYQTQEEYLQTLKSIGRTFAQGSSDNTRKLYGENLIEEIDAFAERVHLLLKKGYFQNIDIIHAHDWTTLKAGAVLKRETGKPFIAHVHITEVNKNAGLGVNMAVYDIEREGFFAADKLVAVSNGVKQTLIDHYGIPAERIEVIHNGGVEMDPVREHKTDFKGDNKIVSYLGRVTGMKGPEHFVEMAAKVLQHCPKTKFVMGGTGDKLQSCIDRAKSLGIQDKFYFHGFYNRNEANKFYDLSDVFVLPSHMEPFGVTPLEAMIKDTPTVITKQSGVAEVIDHCFKVDFWDVDKMASQVIALLKFPKLHERMKEFGREEASALTWDKPASHCINLYQQLRA